MKAEHRHPDQEPLERAIDAGLASFPVEPLPAEFSKSVMNAVRNEPAVETSLATVVGSIFAPLSPQNLLDFGSFLYQEARSVRAQLRRGDVFLAASFALLWCVIAGASVWTMRLLPEQIGTISTIANGSQLSLLTPLSMVIGFALVIEILLIYFYLEQREN